MVPDEKYLAAVSMLGGQIGDILQRVSKERQHHVTEIRLRQGRPLCLMEGNQPCFIAPDGSMGKRPLGACIPTKENLQEIFVALCGWAVHSHQKELTDGYISIRGGHRAGIAATAVVCDGRITSVRDITSINLRIAREIFGVADPVMKQCFQDTSPGVLIVGAPASGKTTLLRDLARQLAGQPGGYQKVCVVDESGEIGGTASGNLSNDLGVNSDLLSGYPKAKGLQVAVRYLSPQVLLCDEIAAPEEIEAVLAASNCGVGVVTSVHAGNLSELARKRHLRALFHAGVFSYCVMLAGADTPAKAAQIVRTEELFDADA